MNLNLSQLSQVPLWLKFLIATLATWRLSSLLVNEDGPNDMFLIIRTRLGVHLIGDDDRPESNLGRLFSCIWCMSVWVGAFIALVAITPYWVLLIPFALSAAAIAIDRWVKIQ